LNPNLNRGKRTAASVVPTKYAAKPIQSSAVAETSDDLRTDTIAPDDEKNREY